jgi:signal transduction histidine kinase/CheY-like chemotaxis protein/HPt (histidine-containing phosphotransfer) domain-containing protein
MRLLRRSPRRSPSLRRYIAVWLCLVGALVSALLVVATLQVRAVNRQADAEEKRAAAFLLADRLRQSSNDLTNMARLYVATGEPRYRDYFFEILAIRSGDAPRPIDYGSSFWDRVLAEGKGFVRYGPARSLADQMRAASFPDDEIRALQQALDTSNRLTVLEKSVMAQVPGTTPLERSALYMRLVDRHYLDVKRTIMAGIAQFTDLVEARALRDVQSAQDASRRLAKIEWTLVFALVLVGAAWVVGLSRMVLTPLSTLVKSSRRLWGGAYSERIRLRGVSELERVATAFSEMAEAVETDVAARRAAEREAVEARREAEQASRAKAAFLAVMSHEIRTPIVGISGMLEVLARTDLSPQQRHLVATAGSSAAALLRIVGDTLDFSKIEAERLELATTTVSLRSLLKSVVLGLVHTASAKGLLLTWSMSASLAPALIADPLRVRQIVSNLISNAIKFTEHGRIEVAVRVLDSTDEAQTVEVAVRDTGIGIPEDHLPRLFGEYVQAGAATAQQFGGTGLGLVICRRLARLMGGDIDLESAVGEGTTARLTVAFPIGDPAEIDESRPAFGPGFPEARPKPDRETAIRENSLLLVVDDHPVNRAVLGQQLDDLGFQVDFASDGEEALTQFELAAYAMVLTDLNMPRVDGFELTRRIRIDDEAVGRPHTPVIALSANVLTGVAEQCRAAGMDDFVAKPTTIPVLAATLRRWLPHLEWAARTGVAPAISPSTSLDRARLDELAGDDVDLQRSLLREFAAAARADVEELARAVAARDADGAHRAAHRMKGAAGVVGADGLVTLAATIEAELDTAGADWDRVESVAASLRASVALLDGAASTLAQGTDDDRPGERQD